MNSRPGDPVCKTAGQMRFGMEQAVMTLGFQAVKSTVKDIYGFQMCSLLARRLL